MNIQSLGALVMSRKRQDISEDEKVRRRNMLEQNKKIQKKETQRLYGLLQSQLSDRNTIDADSFVNMFGHLNFFKEYIQEGNKQLIRQAFMKGDLQTFYKNQFITRKGEKNNQFMVILEGQVGLYLEIADQYKPSKKQLILIKKLIQGDPIEVGTLIDNQNYVMTTQAVTDQVQILSMNIQNFNKTFFKYESDKFDADLNFLKGVPFISDWPRRNLTALQMCITKYTVPRSQIIYQEGQPSHALFIVKKGEFGQYKKRQFWQRNENIEKGDVVDISEKFKRLEEANNQELKSDNSLNDQQQQGKDNTPTSQNPRTLFRGKSKLDVTKKITGFLAGSVVEMNSDLTQTFTVFDSFGEKEILTACPRQYSIVCKSNSGELIQIKSRHFFIIAQEDPELKFSMMTKMMVDNKKSEIQAIRTNLTFRNENQLQLLNNNLSNIEELQEKVNMINTTGSFDHFVGKQNPLLDSITVEESTNKSSLNKMTFNPNNGQQAMSNKQINSHFYKQQDEYFQNEAKSQNANMTKRPSQFLQNQRQSIIVTDLSQYLKSENNIQPRPSLKNSTTVSRSSVLIVKPENSKSYNHSPILSQKSNPRQIKDYAYTPSSGSRNKIDSLQDIESQDHQVLKLPIIKTNYSNSYSQNSHTALTTKSQGYQVYNNSFTSAFDKQSTGSLTPNSSKGSFNFQFRKSFNLEKDVQNEIQPIRRQQPDFTQVSHLNTQSSLPSNNYSSRPLIHQISYSSYQIKL